MQLVANKRADAFVLDDVLLAGQIANSNNAADFKILDGGSFWSEPYGAMFRKDDPQFKALVDKTVTNMIKSGELEKLYKTWFESPIPPKNVEPELQDEQLHEGTLCESFGQGHLIRSFKPGTVSVAPTLNRPGLFKDSFPAVAAVSPRTPSCRTLKEESSNGSQFQSEFSV